MKNKWLLFLFALLCTSGLMAEDKLPPLHHRSNLLMPETMSASNTLLFEVTDKGHHKVVCKSCHGLQDIQDKDFDTVDKQQDDFLRGGPYRQLSDFCYLCHDQKQNQRENIHILLDNDGKKKEQQCLYCHTALLKQEELNIINEQKPDLKLRLPVETICYGCHLRTPHLNALEHQVKIKDKMLAHLKKSRQLYNVTMPLGEKNQLTCITCHDPHQQGVLKKKNKDKSLYVSEDLQEGVSYETHSWADIYAEDKKERLQELNLQAGNQSILHYQRIKNEVLLRLPAKNGMLCIACHDFSQERLW